MKTLAVFLVYFFIPILSSSAQECAQTINENRPLSQVSKVTQEVCAKLLNCQIQSDSNDKVIHCKKNLATYPRPVHFYIPTSLDLNKPIEHFLHFHGHNIGYDHFKKTKNPGEGYGDYGAFLEQSKVNGILAIPESSGKCTDYDQYFASAKNTQAFLSDFKKSTNSQDTSLHLSGHSGAYRVLNRLAKQANEGSVKELSALKSIGLFDATYGSVDGIEQWVKNKQANNQSFLFYNTFVEGPKATAAKISHDLMKKYQNANPEQMVFVPVKDDNEKNGVLLHFNVLRDGSLQSFFQRSVK